MFRNQQSAGSTSQVMNAAEAKQQSHYDLYLLPDDKIETLTEARQHVNRGNTVLLYPDPNDTSSSSSGSRKYKACIIRDGQWILDEKDKLTKVVVTMGSHILSGSGLLPSTTPNYTHLINTALSKARIEVPPLLRITQDIQKYNLHPFLDGRSLYGFSQISFYASTLTK